MVGKVRLNMKIKIEKPTPKYLDERNVRSWPITVSNDLQTQCRVFKEGLGSTNDFVDM